MAPTTKRGAPASASKPVRRKKPSTPERDAKLRKYMSEQKAIKEEIKTDEILNAFAAPGHPQKWTAEIEKKFEQLVSSGVPVRTIGRRMDMPNEYNLWTWIGQTDHPCANAYARGKQRRVAKLEEQIEIIAQTPFIGTITTEKYVPTKFGLEQVTETRRFDNVDHRRLLIDTYKWTLSHTRPKKHGRQPEQDTDKKNDQLDSLFQALMSGPAKDDE